MRRKQLFQPDRLAKRNEQCKLIFIQKYIFNLLKFDRQIRIIFLTQRKKYIHLRTNERINLYDSKKGEKETIIPNLGVEKWQNGKRTERD